MIRYLKITVMMVSVMVIVACSAPKADTISHTELTKREETLIGVNSDNYFVFDYKTQEEFESISLWIEKYEFGELVEDEGAKMTTSIDGAAGYIAFISTKQANNSNKIGFNFGAGNNEGTFSSARSEATTILTGNVDGLSSVWGSFSEDERKIDGEMVLATLAYSTGEFGVSSVTTDFYIDPVKNFDELKEYDVAYLFKVEFVK